MIRVHLSGETIHDGWSAFLIFCRIKRRHRWKDVKVAWAVEEQPGVYVVTVMEDDE